MIHFLTLSLLNCAPPAACACDQFDWRCRQESAACRKDDEAKREQRVLEQAAAPPSAPAPVAAADESQDELPPFLFDRPSTFVLIAPVGLQAYGAQFTWGAGLYRQTANAFALGVNFGHTLGRNDEFVLGFDYYQVAPEIRVGGSGRRWFAFFLTGLGPMFFRQAGIQEVCYDGDFCSDRFVDRRVPGGFLRLGAGAMLAATPRWALGLEVGVDLGVVEDAGFFLAIPIKLTTSFHFLDK